MRIGIREQLATVVLVTALVPLAVLTIAVWVRLVLILLISPSPPQQRLLVRPVQYQMLCGRAEIPGFGVTIAVGLTLYSTFLLPRSFSFYYYKVTVLMDYAQVNNHNLVVNVTTQELTLTASLKVRNCSRTYEVAFWGQELLPARCIGCRTHKK